MGWLEFKAWRGVVRRQLEGPQPDPGRWTPASEANFKDLHEAREKLRGRA